MMLADDGVVSTVTVLSVSSPGEMEVKLRVIHILRKHISGFILKTFLEICYTFLKIVILL